MAPLPGSEPGALNKAKIMNETAWMVYCCCEGWGCGPFADPLIASEVKELCLRSSTSTTDISAEDGLCNYTEVCLCFTSHCSLPPVKGAPMFACCNQKCCGSCGSVAFNTTGGLFEESQVMEETFWVTYCLCEGGGINKMDQGFFAMQFKELCCRGYTNIEPLVIYLLQPGEHHVLHLGGVPDAPREAEPDNRLLHLAHEQGQDGQPRAGRDVSD
mmetsp:Transcript_20369/g.53808  ORF Transcript_20369/g.53808 Transcript_20369/m.53808 type:complete len:215 (+) Transcript_20369:84-728(+)